MAFKDVSSKVDFPAQEREVLAFWEESEAFSRLRALHQDDPPWSFIDGPITANNPMGVHHGWGRTYKDVVQRFWTMRGRKLRFQNGFDCQGLHVEVEVEKELGFKSKKDLEEYGVEAFVRRCKARVLRSAATITEQSTRLGYWMDWDDPDRLRALAEKLLADPAEVITLQGPGGPVSGTVESLVGRLGLPNMGGSYFTFSDENNYMIWAFLKKCWEKGWVYHGVDVMPWCPRCATALSQHEIVTDGYMELTHPSVTLKLPLRERPGEALLVWTTTPWTLTSNVAAAVGPDLTYVRVRQGQEVFYLSKGALRRLAGPYEVLGELSGRELEGWTYEGPYDELPAANEAGGHTSLKGLAPGVTDSARQAHRVILWAAVGEEEGTGIVHIAPGCGAEDFQLGKEYGLPLVAPLEGEGHFIEGFGWLTGRHVSEVAGPIFEDLARKGLLYQVEPYTHRYPTCWRCKTELVFRLVDEWFIHMGEVYDRPRETLTPEEKARSLRYQIMDVVDGIRWIPAFGHAREMDWLRNMHDWMISKKRYWGLALPIWVCQECERFEVIGSEAELKNRAVGGWEAFEGHTPHRPYVDAVVLACPACSGQMRRVPEVGNPWLDAGIVPFSTLGYRADPEYWRAWYPADWISESFPGQFRNWFYSLLAMATVMDGSPPFRQLFGYSTLLAEDGREMHKSLGNAIEFNAAADRMGVDVMRWLFCTQRPENDLLFGYAHGDEARRQFLLPLWNVYSFFVTYANLDGWKPSLTPGPSPTANGETGVRGEGVLDRWVLARLNQVTAEVTADLENSEFTAAAGALAAFLDDLTNWYVRRSRRRFWKSAPPQGETDPDKEQAYATLYQVLVRLVRLLAPIAPFVTESMYQNLVRSVSPTAPASVHHTGWPEADAAAIDPGVLAGMDLARRVAGLGLSARNAAGLKVRQPLAKVLVYLGNDPAALEAWKDPASPLVEIVLDELNVKSFELVEQTGRLVSYRVLPDNKLLGPRFGARFPQVRAALAALDPAAVAAVVQSGEPLRLEVENEAVELAPQEVLVQTQPAPGLAVAADKFATVALETTITPGLRAEGLAREVVRRVQAMRKEAGFNLDDRIQLYYQAGGDLAQVMVNWSGYIQNETLSTALLPSPPPPGAYMEEHTVDGERLRLGVMKN